MLRNKLLLLTAALLVLVSLSGCFPTISSSISSPRDEQTNKDEILVLGVDNTMEESLDKIGSAEFKSSELNTGCEYDDAIEKLKEIASSNGANIIKITSRKDVSGLLEECITLEADFYYIDNLSALEQHVEQENAKIAAAKAEKEKEAAEATAQAEENAEISGEAGEETAEQEVEAETETTTPSTMPADAEYAILYVYRPGVFGFAISYDLHLDDEVLCRVKADWGEAVKVYKNGKHEIWAETEKKVSTPIDIEFGKEYYIRCTVGMGLLIGRPVIKIVEPEKGRPEYEDTTN